MGVLVIVTVGVCVWCLCLSRCLGSGFVCVGVLVWVVVDVCVGVCVRVAVCLSRCFVTVCVLSV